MRIRAGVILLRESSLALIKRVKPNRQYFVTPGGGVEEAEYTAAGAVREAKEELGVEVDIQRLIAVVERVEANKVTHLQLYYHAEIIGGVFGSGTGEEFSRTEQRGSYEPVWTPLEELAKHEVYPSVLVSYLAEKGLPECVLHLLEPYDYPR